MTGEAAVNWSRLREPWPDPNLLRGIEGVPVSWPSKSPFAPPDIGAGGEAEPSTTAIGRLFVPPGPHAARSVPAVVMLHGAGGVLAARELTYAPQLAGMGVAALVVDVFGARRDRGTGFIERLLNITETMMVADAYGGLGFLARRPEIDPRRVVLVGFSYGAMATTFAAFAQIADRLASPGLRFAGHVAFYGPCIARFADKRTTGAPLLMLIGGDDEIVDQQRCAELAADLRAGGSPVETIIYPGAVHQWDGAFERRLIGRNLAGCRLRVERDGTVRDLHTGLAMTGPFRRKLILGLCTIFARPYPIARDDRVRALSNRDLGRFLAKVFSAPSQAS
ncbi:MAG: dienelactone hydrolase family protein [Alphaproteobacteria bacterium]|nr:dienelactone hydrolase family protein [Alphaproteobacteria bacterium]